MSGILYGIGVGPGDPELMTIKAVRRIRECTVIAIPHRSKELCTAYQIACQAVPEMEQKECLYLPMPMTKDKKVLDESHDLAAGAVMEGLHNTGGCEHLLHLQLSAGTTVEPGVCDEAGMRNPFIFSGGGQTWHTAGVRSGGTARDPGYVSGEGCAEASGRQGADENGKTDEDS